MALWDINNIKLTLIKMLITYRGYENPTEELILNSDDPYEYIKNNYNQDFADELFEFSGKNMTDPERERFDQLYLKPDGTMSLVLFSPGEKLSKDVCKLLYSLYLEANREYEDNILELIIIYQGEMTTPVNKCLDVHNIPSVQSIPYNKLLVLPTEHVLSPEYELLTEEEKEELIERWEVDITDYGVITNRNLPTMKITDPVSIQMGYKAGDLIRIIKHDPDSDTPIKKKISYRLISY